MQGDWTYSPEGGDRLASEAEQFERLVPFVSRPQVRVHLLERAAECQPSWRSFAQALPRPLRLGLSTASGAAEPLHSSPLNREQARGDRGAALSRAARIRPLNSEE
jgi:hypothetical protein